MAKYHNECHAVLKEAEVFPIEVDLSRSTFTYDVASHFNDGSTDLDTKEASEVEHEQDCSVGDVDLISTE
jgi:hypothetical protein